MYRERGERDCAGFQVRKWRFSVRSDYRAKSCLKGEGRKGCGLGYQAARSWETIGHSKVPKNGGFPYLSFSRGEPLPSAKPALHSPVTNASFAPSRRVRAPMARSARGRSRWGMPDCSTDTGSPPIGRMHRSSRSAAISPIGSLRRGCERWASTITRRTCRQKLVGADSRPRFFSMHGRDRLLHHPIR
jgi:hypothetical protein